MGTVGLRSQLIRDLAAIFGYPAEIALEISVHQPKCPTRIKGYQPNSKTPKNMHKNHEGVKLLPDPREAGLHLGFQFSYICMFVSLDQNLIPTHSKGQRDKGTKGHNFNVTRNLSGQKKSCNLLGQKKSCNLSGQKKMHKLSGQKNHATYWDKKSRNLSGQNKVMQPIGTKNNLTTSWGKKSCNLTGHKKITQPLGTKQIMQPLKTKISCNLS